MFFLNLVARYSLSDLWWVCACLHVWVCACVFLDKWCETVSPLNVGRVSVLRRCPSWDMPRLYAVLDLSSDYRGRLLSLGNTFWVNVATRARPMKWVAPSMLSLTETSSVLSKTGIILIVSLKIKKFLVSFVTKLSLIFTHRTRMTACSCHIKL